MFKIIKGSRPTLAEFKNTLEEMVKEGLLEKNSRGQYRLLKK